jgi:polar amino acid transport system substrate-binding protein
MNFNVVFLIIALVLPSRFVFSCELAQAKLKLIKYQWLTNEFPPYSYRNEQGKLVGISTDVLMLVYETLGIAIDIKDIPSLPWARLYYNLINHQQYAAFTMTDTPKRKKQFKLIAIPSTSVNISIMVLASKKHLFAKKPIEQLTIGVVRDGIGQQMLNFHHIKAQRSVSVEVNSMLEMLVSNRIDAVAVAENPALFQFNKLYNNSETIVPIYDLASGKFANFIFHNNSSNCATNLFTRTLKKLDEQGQINNIRKKYLQD